MRIPPRNVLTTLVMLVGSIGSARAQAVLGPSAWSFETNQAGAQLSNVRAAGDVNGDGFGDVIASAPLYDGANVDAGRVWLFLGSNAGLSSTPAWSSSGPDRPNAHFGEQISAAGDVDGDGYDDVLVSAPGVSNGQANEGAAFLYRGGPSGLSATPAWIFEGNQVGVQVTAVGTAGDVNRDGYADVLVGAVDPTGTGRVWLFYGRPIGLSTTPAWTIDGASLGAQAGAMFGSRVTYAGDVDSDGFADFLVASAAYSGANANEGRVWLFRGSATVPSTTPAWSWSGGETGAGVGAFDDLGAAGDVDGDGFADVLVAASGLGFDDHGVVWIFRGSASGLSTNPSNTLVGAQSFARFGQGACAAGDVDGDGHADVWIGSPFWSGTSGTIGRVELHRGGASGLAAAADFVVDVGALGPNLQSEMGAQVAGVGDVDGDGFADVVALAPLWNSGQVDEGKAWLFTGRARGLKTVHDWVLARDWTERLGVSVSCSGDINGDGFDDIVSGAPAGTSWAGTFPGKAYVNHGRPGTPSTVPDAVLTAGQPNDLFGTSVAIAGDVNGDGYADVVVGAPRYDDGQIDEGAVFLYLGGPNGISTTPERILEADQAGAAFGWSVAAAGDVDGDGLADVIVGAPQFDAGSGNEGRIFVYLGSTTNPLATLAWSLAGTTAGDALGISVSGGGDVNGDGFSDVLADDLTHHHAYYGALHGTPIAPDWTAGMTQAFSGPFVSNAGDVNGDGFDDVIGLYPPQVWLGSASGLASTPVWSVTNSGESVVASAGDVNGDGYSDIAVGDPFYDPIYGTGRAWVYLGSPTGPSTTPHWFVYGYPGGFSFDVLFGSSFSAGDVDGDGISDLVVGAQSQYFDDPATSRVFLFRGNAGGGPPYATKERRGDNAHAIEPVSRSGSPDSFRMSAIAAAANQSTSTIAGRKRAGLEYEVKPLGVAFDGTGLQRGPALDTGAPGAVFDVLASGLNPGTAYHWRARIATDDPVLSHSRWLSAPVLCRTEAMVRTSRDCNANAIADETDIQNGTSSDTNGDGFPDECQGTPSIFCSGDGSGTPCPCGNAGAPGNGCAHSMNPAGAHLATSGVPSMSHDTLVLHGSGMTPSSSVLYFQGAGVAGNGIGVVFGDGLRCAGGTIVRLGPEMNQSGASSYPGAAGDLPISTKGALPHFPVTRRYQAWYRDAAAFCTPSTFNLTNGITVPWSP